MEAIEMPLIANEISSFQNSGANRNNTGTVPYQLLLELEWYLSKYFKTEGITSVETGCGGATLLFSAYCEAHTIYAVDDEGTESSRVGFVKSWPELKSDKLKWVLGDTLHTLASTPLADEVDIVLINGTHSYPVPDFEMFCLCQRLATNGILIITNTQIPTIQNLFEVLMQDDDYRFQSLKSDTAVFQRVGKAAQSFTGDRWWAQGYNVRNRFDSSLNGIDCGLKLPINFVFGELQKTLNCKLYRGLSTKHGRWFTEGQYSRIQMKIGGGLTKSIKVTLDILPIGIAERKEKFQELGFEIILNSVKVGGVRFQTEGRLHEDIVISDFSGDILDIEFWHIGICVAGELAEFRQEGLNDIRFPNFYLNSISVAEENTPHLEVNSLQRIEGAIFSFEYDKKSFSFLVDEPGDSVKNFHANGQFYEINELEIIRSAVRPQSNVLEVGAHVGNHTVFFSTFLSPKRITILEPNRRTQEILRKNLRLNDVREVDLSYVNYALGASKNHGKITAIDTYSSGSAHVEKNETGDVNIISGDELFSTADFDFIKIDVEGMEMEVLRGLKNLIDRCHPLIFIEVVDSNRDEFEAILLQLNYSINWHDSMYSGISNFLIKHGESKIN
jgi:FkbM family methyltransferase